MSIAAFRWVRPLAVPSTQKLILWALADYADDKGECWPSIASLVVATCLNERAVRRTLRVLETSGLITTSPGNGRTKTSIYTLRMTAADADAAERGADSPPLGPERGADSPPSAKKRGAVSPPLGSEKGGRQSERGAVSPERGADSPPNHQEPSEKKKGEVSQASSSATLPTPTKAEARGTRLPEGWEPDPEERAFAQRLSLDPEWVAAAFRDYWIAQPGARGRKTSWAATWRNWCRKESERPRRPAPAPRFRNGIFELIERERLNPDLVPPDPYAEWEAEAAEEARLAH